MRHMNVRVWQVQPHWLFNLTGHSRTIASIEEVTDPSRSTDDSLRMV